MNLLFTYPVSPQPIFYIVQTHWWWKRFKRTMGKAEKTPKDCEILPTNNLSFKNKFNTIHVQFIPFDSRLCIWQLNEYGERRHIQAQRVLRRKKALILFENSRSTPKPLHFLYPFIHYWVWFMIMSSQAKAQIKCWLLSMVFVTQQRF